MRLERTLNILILSDVLLVALSIVADWTLDFLLPQPLRTYVAAEGICFANSFLMVLWVNVALGTTLSWIGLLNLVRGARALYLWSWIGHLVLTLLSGPVVSAQAAQVLQILGALVGGIIIGLIYFSELRGSFRTMGEAWRGSMLGAA